MLLSLWRVSSTTSDLSCLSPLGSSTMRNFSRFSPLKENIFLF
ncbi:BnaC02g24040D [Brassica napus]|uniref:BnaC02g24040D protein n=1 Tax=Brassica napus TaxID=3708 RepID=A0A078G631_BRANA|nr:BnaC02g24040D [Brassica napus]